jgi:3-(3-hydroxy-phenyl)propionate hydroxylase
MATKAATPPPGVVPIWRELEVSPIPSTSSTDRAPVVIVGAGPVGLALAIDLGLKGHRVVILGRFAFVAAGSKAICFSKRSLDILDRLGVATEAVDKGVDWNVGKVFWKDGVVPIYQFDMLPVKNQKMPGFINLQQYHLEDMLIARAMELENVDLRWGHCLARIEPGLHGSELDVSTPHGDYRITADWVIACDGSKSAVREALALDFEGRVFEDNFLIADVRMKGEQPPERRFWFDPPSNPGRSVLMHKQPDDVWRLDFQLGWDIDRAACARPENVNPLVRALLGPDAEFEEEWYSVYTFQCRRMASFVHGRVLFAGDSAHLVSPFGARGCNGGLADIDNLAWKLDLVLKEEASPELLASYDYEAVITADENILNSTRSTDFLTPKSRISTMFRDTVLGLAGAAPFARRFVNSGRLSTPVSYPESPLNTPDSEDWQGRGIPPGSPPIDAPLGDGWLLERLGGRFALISNGPIAQEVSFPVIDLSCFDNGGVAIERYALEQGGAYLMRPDQYVAARWKQSPTLEEIDTAYGKAKGLAQ